LNEGGRKDRPIQKNIYSIRSEKRRRGQMRTKGKAKPKPEEHADQDDESTENKVYL